MIPDAGQVSHAMRTASARLTEEQLIAAELKKLQTRIASHVARGGDFHLLVEPTRALSGLMEVCLFSALNTKNDLKI